MTIPSYIMIGGFLGAGKTTAMLRLAEHLSARGTRVGLITNDQSRGLVDTSVVEAHGYPVQEITGGCFCCRFNSLTEAADQLSRDARPEAFLAEPVGSCTDLRATVQYPLSRMYGDRYHVAPLSVLVDPLRALRVLGLEAGRSFSPKVVYVYKKQLEEADIIVVNKLDIVTVEQRGRLTAALRERYPAAVVLNISAKTGENLDAWFEHILATQANAAPQDPRAAMDVDYDIYAEGEALLGWLNATVRVTAAAPLDGNQLLADVARGAHAALAGASLEIAHLKMTLAPDEGADIAVLNLVRTDGTPEMSHLLSDDVADAEMIVNLRAEGDPDHLGAIVERAIDEAARAHAASCVIVHFEHFRPARPQPTHRLAALIDQ